MNIIQMSAQASIIIVVAVVIRALGQTRLPKWCFQMLWGVALARLLVPLRIESTWSVYGAARWLEREWPSVAAPMQAPPQVDIASMGMQQGQPALAAHISPWIVVWLVGVALLLAYFGIAHLRGRRRYRSARTISEGRVSGLPLSRALRICATNRIESPLTYGIFRPVILLPVTLLAQDEDIAYVIAHEAAHVRHWDVLKRWLLTLCLCVHWFNPLVWVMYILASRDIELCCDESVLRAFGARQKERYASLLIDMEEARVATMPLASHFGRNAIEERIVAIMKYKKATLFGAALALTLVVGTATALATSANSMRNAHVTGPMEGNANATNHAITTRSAPIAYASEGNSKVYAEPDNQTLYARYAPYGLTYDASKDRLYYQGELVRCFEDLYPVGDGGYSGVSSSHADGTVDVRAIRDLTPRYNADGSYDPSGVLTGVERCSEDEFNRNTQDMEAAQRDAHDGNGPMAASTNVGASSYTDGGMSMTQVYAEYAPYGLRYDASDDRLYMNGERVRFFLDILESNGKALSGGEFQGSIRSKGDDGGSVDVFAERDGGKLTGLRVATQQEFDERTQKWARQDAQDNAAMWVQNAAGAR